MKREQKRKLRTILGKLEILRYDLLPPKEMRILDEVAMRLQKLYNKV